LLQADFVVAAAAALSRLGIDSAVETAGGWSPALVDEVARCIDLVIFDLKHVTPERWNRKLSSDIRRPLENLTALLKTDVELEVSLTLVPGFNDGEDDIRAVAAWLSRHSRRPSVIVRSFHRLASAKQKVFGRAYPYADVSSRTRSQVMERVELLRRADIDASIE